MLYSQHPQVVKISKQTFPQNSQTIVFKFTDNQIKN